MTEFIEIEVEPVDRRGEKYRSFHDGNLVVDGSSDCFSETARELVAAGADMDATLVMYGRGEKSPRLYARMGYAASHRVSGNRFVPWLQKEDEESN